MLATVVVTSKPAPLVARPKLIPTAPISVSLSGGRGVTFGRPSSAGWKQDLGRG